MKSGTYLGRNVVCTRTNATSLIIAADGGLHLLPFNALIDESGKYVLESKSASVTPSGTVLCLLRRRLQRPAATRPYLGVAAWTDDGRQLKLPAAYEDHYSLRARRYYSRNSVGALYARSPPTPKLRNTKCPSPSLRCSSIIQLNACPFLAVLLEPRHATIDLCSPTASAVKSGAGAFPANHVPPYVQWIHEFGHIYR
jgi:hypothetical protein